MTTITIPLTEDRLAKLHTWAVHTGIRPEEFLQQHVEKLLDWRDEQFREALDYILKKNAEVYRRLAQIDT